MTRVFSRCFFGGALTALLVALAAPAFAGGVVYTSWGKAIGGYDPVAYFTDGKPVERVHRSLPTPTWEPPGVLPAPRTAMPSPPCRQNTRLNMAGYTASTDPEAWKVVDGKLYLNYSKGVQRQWVDDGPRTLIKAGDKNWPDLKSNLAN